MLTDGVKHAEKEESVKVNGCSGIDSPINGII